MRRACRQELSGLTAVKRTQVVVSVRVALTVASEKSGYRK